jgi:hypothetical protein
MLREPGTVAGSTRFADGYQLVTTASLNRSIGRRSQTIKDLPLPRLTQPRTQGCNSAAVEQYSKVATVSSVYFQPFFGNRHAERVDKFGQLFFARGEPAPIHS